MYLFDLTPRDLKKAVNLLDDLYIRNVIFNLSKRVSRCGCPSGEKRFCDIQWTCISGFTYEFKNLGFFHIDGEYSDDDKMTYYIQIQNEHGSKVVFNISNILSKHSGARSQYRLNMYMTNFLIRLMGFPLEKL